jgi:hypothetical protein
MYPYAGCTLSYVYLPLDFCRYQNIAAVYCHYENHPPDDIVMFNVHSRIFQTTLTTLHRFPDSVMYKMIEWSEEKHDPSPSMGSLMPPEYYIDPDWFSAILHYHDTDG